MNRYTAALAGAVLCILVANPALASPVFDAFRKVCGDSHGDFAAIKAAADAGHWVPTEVAPNTMEGVTVAESVARQVAVGGTKMTLFAWRGSKGTVQVTACTVKVTQTPFAGVADDAKAWVGFAPEAATSAKAVWRYTENAGVKSAVQKADYDKAAAAGGLDFFTVSQVGPETVLDLLKIKS